jgi:16S rRNA (uracil1498-N3)-methyltransferase
VLRRVSDARAERGVPRDGAIDRRVELALGSTFRVVRCGAADIIPAVHRFYAPALDPGDETVALPREEAEHLTRVLRLGTGDTVTVFDGRGHEWVARVASAIRRDVRVQIVSRLEPTAESTVALTLAQAILKGEKMDEVIRDAVMLGAHAIQPVVSKRSETTVAAVMRGARVERWRRVALASAKQSRRAVLPEIRMPLALETVLGEPPPALRLMMVEPGTTATVEPIAALQHQPAPADAMLLVGPEGGWAAEEWTAAESHGVRLFSLGARTLRADAVPIAAISVLQFIWER